MNARIRFLIGMIVVMLLAGCSPAAVTQPAVSDALKASDPGQYRAASGKVQLVEFFAYW